MRPWRCLVCIFLFSAFYIYKSVCVCARAFASLSLRRLLGILDRGFTETLRADDELNEHIGASDTSVELYVPVSRRKVQFNQDVKEIS